MNQRKNVILITIDALRADHCSSINPEMDLTPNIEQISSEGISFSQASSNAPYTTASVTSFLTSTLPLIPKNYIPFNGARLSLPRLLKKIGFSTYGIHSNPWFQVYGYGDDFDYFQDPLDSREKNLVEKTKNKVRKLDENFLNKTIAKVWSKIGGQISGTNFPYASADQLNSITKKVIEHHHTEDFFLWLHYMDPHEPYFPKNQESSNLDQKTIQKVMKKRLEGADFMSSEEKELVSYLYKCDIRFLDDKIGEIWNLLNEYFNRDEFVFILTSDHGTEMGEQGDFGHTKVGTPPKLYEGLLNVPLVVYDKSLPKGRKIRTQVSLLDLAPTVADLIGIEKPYEFMGESLLRFLENTSRKNGTIAQAIRCKDPNQIKHMKRGARIFSYKENQQKLIWKENNNYEYYNLSKDPNEKKNLLNSQPEVVEKLEKKLFNKIHSLKNDIPEKMRIKAKLNESKSEKL